MNKILATLIVGTVSLHADLGDTFQKCQSLYGQPILQEAPNIYCYDKDGLGVRCVFLNGICRHIKFVHPGMDQNEVLSLLRRNVKDTTWQEDTHDEEFIRYKTMTPGFLAEWHVTGSSLCIHNWYCLGMATNVISGN